jgi:hypothetical protein
MFTEIFAQLADPPIKIIQARETDRDPWPCDPPEQPADPPDEGGGMGAPDPHGGGNGGKN